MQAKIGRWLAAMALLLLACVLGLAALGFGCAAVYLSLSRVTSPPLAAAATALIALAVALIIALIGRSLAAKREQRPVASGPASLASLAPPRVADAMATLRGHVPAVAAAALLAGFALGVSGRLRRAVWRMIV
jgi:hypothetical protein